MTEQEAEIRFLQGSLDIANKALDLCKREMDRKDTAYSQLLQAALELEKAIDGMGPEYCAHLCDQDDFDNPDEWCKFAKDAVESFRKVLKELGEM